jgi:hypothetical protein
MPVRQQQPLTQLWKFIVVVGQVIFLTTKWTNFFKPVSNMYGLVGGEARFQKTGKRKLSSMTPAIITKEIHNYGSRLSRRVYDFLFVFPVINMCLIWHDSSRLSNRKVP